MTLTRQPSTAEPENQGTPDHVEAVAGARRRNTLRRRRLMWRSVLPALIVVGLAVMLLVNVVTNKAARSSYGDGDYAEALDGFRTNDKFMPAQRWIADFNAGDAHYRDEKYESADAAYRRALVGVPDDSVCKVRVNLAATRLELGDNERKAMDRDAAKKRYLSALKAIRADACPKDAPGGKEQTGRSKDIEQELLDRLREIKDQQQQEQQQEEQQKKQEQEEKKKQQQQEKQKQKQEQSPQDPQKKQNERDQRTPQQKELDKANEDAEKSRKDYQDLRDNSGSWQGGGYQW